MTPTTPEQDLVRSRVLTNLRRMLDYRRQYDPKRATFYQQYVGQRVAQRFPDGVTARANTFVPYPLSNVETIVSRTDDAFFSFAPWFECQPATQRDDGAAEAMGVVLDKKLREARAKDNIEQCVRTISIYGHGAIKVDWDWAFKTITKPTAVYATNAQGQPVAGPDGQPIIRKFVPQTFQVPMACPKITPIDIYDLLVDPDGHMKAHLTEMTLGAMKVQQENYTQAMGEPYWDPDALNDLAQQITSAYHDSTDGDPDQVIVRLAEFWNSLDNTMTVITFGDDTDAIAYKDQRASYRAANYSTYRAKAWAGSGTVLRHGDNPFAHKRIPILDTSYIKLPNEVYGLGSVEITAELTEALNKFTNQIADNWNLGINRRYAYDENADIDHEALNQMNVPGGKVAVGGNPNEVLFPLPMFTPNAGDYQILELYRGMIQMTSGVSDFYQKGASGTGGNDTATGISSVINESNYRFKLFIRNIEIDLLTPMLEMCASMCQQFLNDEEEIQITKNPAPGFPKWGLVNPADLIGNFEFNLVAANYATNKTLRQRNLMEYMQIAQQTPYWNQGEGLREVGKILEIRNVDKLIKSDQQVQMEQEQQQRQQMQMMLAQEILGTESKVEVAKARHTGQAASGGSAKSKEGRPQQGLSGESTPGQSAIGIIKSLGQSMGANANGVSAAPPGIGEVPNAAG